MPCVSQFMREDGGDGRVALRDCLAFRAREGLVHCPRAGPGQGQPTFSGPRPWPLGSGQHQLALTRGQANPGPVGPGRVGSGADPGP